MRASIFYGHVCCYEQFFCVANGIVSISMKGVYAGALVKKRWYWPKRLPGDLIDWNFADKEVGGVDMLDASI